MEIFFPHPPVLNIFNSMAHIVFGVTNSGTARKSDLALADPATNVGSVTVRSAVYPRERAREKELFESRRVVLIALLTIGRGNSKSLSLSRC